MTDSIPEAAPVDRSAVDAWSKHIWHVSQHDRMVITLGGRLQEIANEMRTAAGLPEFGWSDAVSDEVFQQCTVHLEGCLGQQTHGMPGDAAPTATEGAQ